MEMEKQLSVLGYWLGLLCTVLALIFRLFIAIHLNLPFLGPPGSAAVSILSLVHAAALFYLLAIASWCRTAKS
jgi:hypothetical protein